MLGQKGSACEERGRIFFFMFYLFFGAIRLSARVDVRRQDDADERIQIHLFFLCIEACLRGVGQKGSVCEERGIAEERGRI